MCNCLCCVHKYYLSLSSKDRNEKVTYTIEGKTYEYAKFDEEKCFIGFQMGSEEKNPFLYDGSADSEVARWIMKAIYNDDSPTRRQRQIHSNFASYEVAYKKHLLSMCGVNNFEHPGTACGASCQRECMIHLEKQDKLTDKFHTPFRIRKPYKLDPEKLLDQAKDLYAKFGDELINNAEEVIKNSFKESVSNFFSDMGSTVKNFFSNLFS